MERLLKTGAGFALLTAFWLGVIGEAVATCLATSVCSYPDSLVADLAVLVYFAAMTVFVSAK